jgi:uncharacterized protein (DUF433 family)
MNDARIIDRGRGPEIADTRITVYDLIDYLEHGWRPSAIADLFQITEQQVNAGIRYLDAHRSEVMAAYRRNLERVSAGNSPDLQAKLDASHQKMLALREELASAAVEGNRNARSGARR